MEGKIAFLFAGQGSQKRGMGQDFYENYPIFKSVFDSVKLDFDLKEACFTNPDNMLLSTRYTQPCMVAFACGINEVLRSKNISPDYVCGLSLGEYSALYAAGVWSLEDTMKIIAARGAAMAEASEGIEASMVAITALAPEIVVECCKKAEKEGVVSVCNLNCPGQVVVGGDKIAVDCAVQYAKEAGARRCVPLEVSGPFHTQYMESAGKKLDNILQNIVFNEPECEVLFNYLGGPKQNGQSIIKLLINQIQHTVRMQECIEYLIKSDVKTFLEIGPGTTLSGFVKKTLKSMNKSVDEYSIIKIENIEDLHSKSSLI